MSIARFPLLAAAVGLFALISARPAEAQAPEVVACEPADGAIGVPAGVSPKVTFSEAMDPASIGPGTCKLQEASGYPQLILGTPGLISYWRLGERSGSVAKDVYYDPATGALLR